MTPFTSTSSDAMLTLAVLAEDHPAEAAGASQTERTAPARELARRVSDGITVVMLWRPGDSGVLVDVSDAKTGEKHHIAVDGARAMDAFHHPFAYAA